MALQYAEHHADRLPIVMLARVAREWDPRAGADGHRGGGEGRPSRRVRGTRVLLRPLPFGVAGIVVLRRRRIDQWFLLVPAAVVTVVSALVIALVRHRAPFEVCLVVLAGVGIVVLAQRVSGRRRGGTTARQASAMS